MKLLRYYAIASLQFSLIVTTAIPAIAQNTPGCYMLDANGNPTDLGYLCGTSPNNANSSTLRNRKTRVSNSSDFFVVPIKRRIHGTPVIDVKFNDKYIFEMLFDTGATMTVITKPMAKTLKLKPTGSLPFQTASNNLIYFEISSVSSASAGNMVSNNLNIAVAPTIDMGLLGQNFYGMYDITIKYGTIEFRRR
ncbi:putative aspartyl protease [Hyella patelloides LEGE 07179]|uniref:Putative aspartyl protease n=1 Tax=Hyella patelloides LEGE 07179 TaxID=945734 RepID=A0A563VTP2_9CYAN|nr:retropepsin-like aspartic protease [Hyella patelloides]VEP14775.1 putative aspartyl protease [Hyella patelloides LEGE 07179]